MGRKIRWFTTAATEWLSDPQIRSLNDGERGFLHDLQCLLWAHTTRPGYLILKGRENDCHCVPAPADDPFSTGVPAPTPLPNPVDNSVDNSVPGGVLVPPELRFWSVGWPSGVRSVVQLVANVYRLSRKRATPRLLQVIQTGILCVDENGLIFWPRLVEEYNTSQVKFLAGNQGGNHGGNHSGNHSGNHPGPYQTRQDKTLITRQRARAREGELAGCSQKRAGEPEPEVATMAVGGTGLAAYISEIRPHIDPADCSVVETVLRRLLSRASQNDQADALKLLRSKPPILVALACAKFKTSPASANGAEFRYLVGILRKSALSDFIEQNAAQAKRLETAVPGIADILGKGNTDDDLPPERET